MSGPLVFPNLAAAQVGLTSLTEKWLAGIDESLLGWLEGIVGKKPEGSPSVETFRVFSETQFNPAQLISDCGWYGPPRPGHSVGMDERLIPRVWANGKSRSLKEYGLKCPSCSNEVLEYYAVGNETTDIVHFYLLAGADDDFWRSTNWFTAFTSLSDTGKFLQWLRRERYLEREERHFGKTGLDTGTTFLYKVNPDRKGKAKEYLVDKWSALRRLSYNRLTKLAGELELTRAQARELRQEFNVAGVAKRYFEGRTADLEWWVNDAQREERQAGLPVKYEGLLRELDGLEFEHIPERYLHSAITVNVNTATRDALAAVPGLGRSAVERILSIRARRRIEKVGDLNPPRKSKPYLRDSGSPVERLYTGTWEHDYENVHGRRYDTPLLVRQCV